MSLPTTPEAITADWLGTALEAPVAEVTVLDRQLGTNRNARLRVRIVGSENAPRILFVKLPPDEPQQRALVIGSGMGEREAHFYQRLATRVPLRVPDVAFADVDDDTGNFVILIEDVLESGCRLPEGKAGVSTSFAERAMDDLAALHAELPASDPDAAWVPGLLRMREYGVGMLEHALASRAELLSPEFAEMAQLYIDSFDLLHDLWESGSQSVVHGDAHVANLFEDGDRPGFLDWGCFSVAPPLRDVSYFLCMALSVENRRQHEKRLIERYLARREALGAPGPGFPNAWAQHQVHAGYTIVAAAPAALYGGAAVSLDPAYSAAFVERASRAVADLESAARIRAELGL
ncbi:MAG: phosphotransferase [Myxococcota bacterium]